MSEVARKLSGEEVAARISADIEAYRRGGPDREAENLAIGRGVLDEAVIRASWAEARAWAEFHRLLAETSTSGKDNGGRCQSLAEAAGLAPEDAKAMFVDALGEYFRQYTGTEEAAPNVPVFVPKTPGAFFSTQPLPGDESKPTAQPSPAPFTRRLGDGPKVEAKAEPKAEPTLRLIIAEAKPAKLPPGVIGEIAEFTVDSAMYPIMKYSIAVGIGVVGTLISRRIGGPTGPRGCATHLYQALIGPTGIGKDHARAVGKLLLSTAAARSLIGPGRFKSGPALVKHVEQKPVSLCFIDELGAYFEKLSDPRASGWEKEISEVLRELWGMNWGRYDSPMGAHDESKVIIHPALSLMGLTTPKELYRACKSREVSNGYLNRWNFVEEQDQPDWQRTDEGSLDVPPGLRNALRKLYKPVPIMDENGGPPERLAFGPGAEDVYHAIREGIEAETDDRRRELCWRSPEKTVRIATSIAAGCFDQRVTREYMEWSWEWVKAGDETLIVGVNEYMEEEKLEFGELCKEIIRRVRRNAIKLTIDTGEGRREVVGMLEREIGRSFQNNIRYKRDLRDALEHLRETDQLISTNLTAVKGRPSYLLSIAK